MLGELVTGRSWLNSWGILDIFSHCSIHPHGPSPEYMMGAAHDPAIERCSDSRSTQSRRMAHQWNAQCIITGRIICNLSRTSPLDERYSMSTTSG